MSSNAVLDKPRRKERKWTREDERKNRKGIVEMWQRWLDAARMEMIGGYLELTRFGMRVLGRILLLGVDSRARLRLEIKWLEYTLPCCPKFETTPVFELQSEPRELKAGHFVFDVADGWAGIIHPHRPERKTIIDGDHVVI